MGEEITDSRFELEDFERYRARLEQETALLREWFESRRLREQGSVGGFELEAWLVDALGRPAPCNDTFLARLTGQRSVSPAGPLVSPELAKFNVELNSTPQPLERGALSTMHAELVETWASCRDTAADLYAGLLMIGILPTVADADLTLANMSGLRRYRALNEQVLRLRRGRPIVLDIKGEQHLRVEHEDVMLESAATSFQIHIQVGQQRAARYLNAAIVLSAPMVALCANSPYLFGKDLWDETRIPLFEQAVPVGGYDGAAFGPIRRVTFGSDYVHKSVLEYFVENLEHYPVLLPAALDTPPEALGHLRLHNGTIWRWNRPLIGFESDGTAHLRIEHRVAAAGPSVLDTIANAAFFFGLVSALAESDPPPESLLDFSTARDNFYTAARLGLRANVRWLDGRTVPVQQLLSEHLLPLARSGLERLDIASVDIGLYLGVIADRLRTGRNGARWQRAFVAEHGSDMRALTAAYRERQDSGAPVHEWSL
ncbi:MAG TPA: glutamate--cysteine ligase [Gammaproteobacteria bacterium]|nr:glutamate--cysteine ligase [Gammaproteobacteria bacterium]